MCSQEFDSQATKVIPQAPDYSSLLPVYDKLLRIRLGDGHAERGGLQETPMRAAKFFMEMTSGYKISPESILKTFEDGAENYDELVFVGHIPFWSLCEHHLAPFFGHAYVGYLPASHKPKIVGLSKLSRLVDVFAHRLQVQERMTAEIANTLVKALEPRGVGVVLKARHSCMESRGIKRAGCVTLTAKMTGNIKDSAPLRNEFYKLVELADRDNG